MMKRLLEWVLPIGVCCIACGEARRMDGEHVLCERCREKLAQAQVPASACDRCLSYVPEGGRCAFCRDGGMEYLHKSHAPFMYVHVARRLIKRLKFDDVNEALDPLADAMAEALTDRDFDMIAPVPLHFLRQRRRGCNQAMLLAKGVSVRTGIPVCDVLKRLRATKPQSTLAGFRRRKQNVENAFAIMENVSVEGKKILLLDDVRTSGSTARACAKALLQGGAGQVSLLTACVVYQYRGKKHGSVAGKNGAAAGQ